MVNKKGMDSKKDKVNEMTKKQKNYKHEYLAADDDECPNEDIIFGLWCLKYGEWVRFVRQIGICDRLTWLLPLHECLECYWAAINVKFLGNPLTNMPAPMYLEYLGLENEDIKLCEHDTLFIRCEDYPGTTEDVWLIFPDQKKCNCKNPIPMDHSLKDSRKNDAEKKGDENKKNESDAQGLGINDKKNIDERGE